MSKKEAELRVKLEHLSALSCERFSAAQTVPETDTTATFISNATNKANPLSNRKYLQAACKKVYQKN